MREDDNARVETRNHTDFNEINQRTVSAQNTTLTYDGNGNTTDTGYSSLGGQSFPGGGLRMEWDALNRLRKVWKNNNTPGSTGDDILVGDYTYDCQNRRMRKVVTNSGSLNGTTDFYYEGWRVVEEHDGSDAILQQYTYGNYLDEVWTLDNRRSGITVAQLNDLVANERHFYHANTLYDVYGLTDETTALKEAYQYDPYGRQTVINDGDDADMIVNFNSNDVRTLGGASTVNGNPYMYTGQRLDPESGLAHFKERYLSLDLGTFLSRDAIGSVNRYEYSNGAPTMKTDKFGLLAITVEKMTEDICGGYDVEFKFTSENAEGGYFVQEIIVYEDSVWCDPKRKGKVAPYTGRFWEAFPVNVPFPSPGTVSQTDKNARKSTDETRGYHLVLGEVRYFNFKDVQKIPSEANPWRRGSEIELPSEALYSTTDRPHWWDQHADGPAMRYVVATWSCCCGEDKKNRYFDVFPHEGAWFLHQVRPPRSRGR